MAEIMNVRGAVASNMIGERPLCKVVKKPTGHPAIVRAWKRQPIKFESKFVRVEINANLHYAARSAGHIGTNSASDSLAINQKGNLEKSGDLNTMAKIPTFKRSIWGIEVTVGFNVPFCI